MAKVWLIVQREFFTRVFTLTFAVTTFLIPLLIIAAGTLSSFLLTQVIEGKPATQVVAVVGYYGDTRLAQRLEALLKGYEDGPKLVYRQGFGWQSGTNIYEFHPVNWAPPENWPDFLQRLKRDLEQKRYTAYVLVPPAVYAGENRQIQVYSSPHDKFAITDTIQNALRQAVLEIRLNQAGVEPVQANKLAQGLKITVLDGVGAEITSLDDAPSFSVARPAPALQPQRGKITETNARMMSARAGKDLSTEPLTMEENQSLSRMLWLTFFTLTTFLLQYYNGMVLRGVVEEKSSKIIEVLLSSVSSFQLMLGKLLGIGFVGLTQLFIWASIALGLSIWSGSQSVRAQSFSLGASPGLVLALFVYLGTGYLLCATFSLIVGALTRPETNSTPVIGVFLALFSPALQMPLVLWLGSKPDSSMLQALSLIPVFSPVLMPLRIAVSTPPWWHITLSLCLLVLAILGAVKVAAKIYRVSLMAQGTTPNTKQLLVWLKAS
jgi:ABC-type Na+ efflux pump permease subunit